MKLLLHICCGPCAIYPLRVLREKGWEIRGYYYNSNIHPYTEFLRRKETLAFYADRIDLPVIYQKDYDMEGWLRQVVFRESNRCDICYFNRLEATARMAKKGKFDGFSTTLLYSKFQKHDRILSIGESLGKSVGVPFHYQDFREGWKEGIETSKSLGMYRQPYCGCIYSEKERYYKEQAKNERDKGADGQRYNVGHPVNNQ